MPGTLPPAERREARVALAMLPVGGTVFVVSLVAFVAVAAMAVDLAWRGLWGWSLAWSVAAAGVSLWNARAGIAIMSAFDWRPLPRTVLTSTLVLIGWLALPVPA